MTPAALAAALGRREMSKIGFIGLGRMGRGMSLNLLRHGHQLVVLDVDAQAEAVLLEAGAAKAADPAGVADQAEVVVLSLPGPPEVDRVVTGPRGLLDSARPGTIVIDTSTIDPITSRRMAQSCQARGVDFLDAPLAGGGPRGAAEGKQTLIVGGPAEALERCRPILTTLGNQVVHAGGHGQGLAVKLCFQIYSAMGHVAAAEAFTFGVKLGVDPRLIFQVIDSSRGGDWLLRNKCPYPGCSDKAPANRGFAPDFALDMALKDYGLVVSTAQAMKMPMMMANLAYQFFESAIQAGLGDKDVSAVSAIVRRLAGVPEP